MKIQELLKKYPVYFKYSTHWSYWTKKCGPVHLPVPNCCSVPKLGNNYSEWGIEDNREVCPQCLHIFFTNLAEDKILPEDKKYLTYPVTA